LRLRALEEPFRNEEICVLHPIENVEPDEIPELDILRPGRIARFQLLMDAIRLSLAPGDDRLVSSSRSKIDFERNQQVPALRALELPRPRLLIADDVGLGKTIDAGLILRELNARRRAARILIVSPASITEQWQTELATKFGFEFRIFDSEGVAEARRALEAGTNPWCVEPRVIASVDFIKRREGAFRELSASRWDVIIIDEAHHLASGGNDDDLTDRYRLARWLAAENTGGLLLLTATPHDGYDRNFSSLLELLEPSLVTPGRDLKFEQYRKHMVRRLKRHIRLADGSPKFVEREPVQPIPVTYSPAYSESFRSKGVSCWCLPTAGRTPTRHALCVVRNNYFNCADSFTKHWPLRRAHTICAGWSSRSTSGMRLRASTSLSGAAMTKGRGGDGR
jgi:SNF2 family DNA or RNA helicase